MSADNRNNARSELMAGRDARFWGHSRLEENISQNWPPESDYFPSWDDPVLAANFPRNEKWTHPLKDRSSLFESIIWAHLVFENDVFVRCALPGPPPPVRRPKR